MYGRLTGAQKINSYEEIVISQGDHKGIDPLTHAPTLDKYPRQYAWSKAGHAICVDIHNVSGLNGRQHPQCLAKFKTDSTSRAAGVYNNGGLDPANKH